MRMRIQYNANGAHLKPKLKSSVNKIIHTQYSVFNNHSSYGTVLGPLHHVLPYGHKTLTLAVVTIVTTCSTSHKQQHSDSSNCSPITTHLSKPDPETFIDIPPTKVWIYISSPSFSVFTVDVWQGLEKSP